MRSGCEVSHDLGACALDALQVTLAGSAHSHEVYEAECGMRYCKKCKEQFEADVCNGGHAIFMYVNKIPDGAPHQVCDAVRPIAG